MTRHRIPIRVGTPSVSTRSVYPEAPAEQAQGESPEQTQRGSPEQAQRGSQPTIVGDPRSRPLTEQSLPAYSESKDSEEQDAWHDRALRLQADMDNYRKRQRRIAREEAQAGQDRLLRDLLGVADNLDRTLAARQSGSNGLRQGVELTRDELLRVLGRHDLERFEAQGMPFDPAWHEAVHVVSARALGVEPGTVVEQIQPGYRKHDAVHGDRLFRPAQVVVAN